MNREILFKAVSIEGKWVEGYYAEEDCKAGILVDTKLFDMCKRLKWVDVHPDTVCQYYGNSDKNMEKVFTCDMLKDHAGNIWIIEYQAGLGGYVIYDVKRMIGEYPASNTNMSKLEVIGNIHDDKMKGE